MIIIYVAVGIAILFAGAVLMARTMKSANRNSLYHVSILVQGIGSVFILS